jgi:DNA repair protein RecO (recombination protein O)
MVMPSDLTSSLHQTEAIVMRTRLLGENARIITFLSPLLGRVEGVDRGHFAAMAARYEPFTLGELVLTSRKRGGLHSVDSFEIVQTHDALRTNLEVLCRAWYLTELVERTSQENQSAEKEFDLLLQTYGQLVTAVDPECVCRWFEIQLLRIAGVGLILDRCAVCERDMGLRMKVSLESGGILCETCSPDRTPLLSKGTIMTMRRLSMEPLARAGSVKATRKTMTEMTGALRALLASWLGELPRSVDFMDEVIQGMRRGGETSDRSSRRGGVS